MKVAATPKRAVSWCSEAGPGESRIWRVGAEASSNKKKAGKGAGVATPTPVRGAAAAGAQPPVTPAKPASAVRPAGKKAEVRDAAGNKAAKPGRVGAGVPPTNQPSRRSRRRQRAVLRRRLPRTAAVGLSMEAAGNNGAPTLADILRRARTEIPNVTKAFGTKTVKPRRMASGGLLLEIPGPDASRRAKEMASQLRALFPDGSGVRISRPVKRVELRIAGFDEPVTPREIAAGGFRFADDCAADEVRMGAIRSTRDGLFTAWVQVPASAGVPLAERGRLELGWGSARMALLKGMPLRCFKCLAPGHVQQRCPCPEDRARCCYNCGQSGHVVAACKNRPHCPSCAERGLKAGHKPGGVGCTPVNLRREPTCPSPPRPRGGGGNTARSGVGSAGVPVSARSSADTEIMPGRAEDGASLGSSPLSPPGKRACVGRSSPQPEHTGRDDPKPRREPCQRLDPGPAGTQPAPAVAVEEVEMADAAEGRAEAQATVPPDQRDQ